MTQLTKDLINGYKMLLVDLRRTADRVYDELSCPLDLQEKLISEMPESDGALGKEVDVLNLIDGAREDLHDAIEYIRGAIEGLRKAMR